MQDNKMNTSETALGLVDNKDLNIYKDVHLYFYSYQDGELQLLLYKDNTSSDSYKEFFTEITKIDNLPTFAVSRIMSTRFRGIFTLENLEKLKNKVNLNEHDLSPSANYDWTTIWENEKFIDWLNIISSNPIQYDYLDSKMVYFIECPYLDTSFVNDNLKELNIDLTLNWFNYEKLKNSSNYSSLVNVFDFNNHIKMTKKLFAEDNVDYYIIIACKKSENKKDQAGFFHFPALIPGIYRRNLEKWIYLVSSCDAFPSEEMLKKTKAIIIPGSDLNIYNKFDFLRKTEEFIRYVILNHQDIKFLGLCFGMQILATSLGGVVEPIGTFITGPEKLKIQESFWDLDFVKKSNVEKRESLNIHQAHGDYVKELPSGEFSYLEIKTLSLSESCPCEIIVSKNERIFCIQGHAEYDTEFVLSRAAVFLCKRMGIEPTRENIVKFKEERLKGERYILNSNEFRKICHSFLKN
jgi:GMP synthase-like glutamine amidotransferase